MRFRSLEFNKLDKSHLAVGIGGAAVTGVALEAARALRAKAKEPWSAIDMTKTYPLTKTVLSKLQKGNQCVALSSSHGSHVQLLLEIQETMKEGEEGRCKVKVIDVKCTPDCGDTETLKKIELVLAVKEFPDAFRIARLYYEDGEFEIPVGKTWEVYTVDKTEEQWKEALGGDFEDQFAEYKVQDSASPWKQVVDAFEQTSPEATLETAVSDHDDEGAAASTGKPLDELLDLSAEMTPEAHAQLVHSALSRLDAGQANVDYGLLPTAGSRT